MRRLFYGGVHPPDGKQISLQGGECREAVPGRVVIPMLQHIGTPCRPLVQVGDYVRVGEKIGDGDGLCVPVHASVSGRVSAVEPRLHPNGRMVLSVEIQNDFQDATVRMPLPPASEMGVDEILMAMREAGIVGMGGAAFPGNAKALAAMGRVDILLANGCECEPYITADDCLMRLWPEAVLRGIRSLTRLLGAKRTVLAVEENKSAIGRLQQCLPEFLEIELRALPVRYPQGSEKQLIQAVTGREVPGGQLPVEAGCAVFNVSTLAAVDRALRAGRALTRRIVTVSGPGIRRPQNFVVPIGTPFDELIRAAGGMTEDADCVLSGGPMMGIAQTDISVPVVKATNAILCLRSGRNGAEVAAACIRCGKCLSVCPMRLQPLYLYRFEAANDTAALMRLHLTDCIECGSCAFICPAGLALVERFRRGKQKLKEAKLK